MSSRVLLGNHANFGYGLFISKENKDVHTNLDPEDLLFDSRSDYTDLIHDKVAITCTSGAQSASASIVPSLSYEPMCLWNQTSTLSGDYKENQWLWKIGGMGSLYFGQYIRIDVTSSTVYARAHEYHNRYTFGTGGFPSTLYVSVLVLRIPADAGL